jgi:hypothetical protein
MRIPAPGFKAVAKRYSQSRSILPRKKTKSQMLSLGFRTLAADGRLISEVLELTMQNETDKCDFVQDSDVWQ